jgi:hypothetical protein
MIRRDSHTHDIAHTPAYARRSTRVAYLKRCAAQQLERGNSGHAAELYSKALALLGDARTADSKRQRAVLLCNRSAALLRAGAAERALADAEAAAAAAQGWAKPHWRRGRALAELLRWPEALAAYLTAWVTAEPGGPEQGECEAAAAGAAARLTAQQTADALLELLQSHQLGSCGCCGSTALHSASGAGINSSSSSVSGDVSWLVREEQREAMRSLVAQPPPAWALSAAAASDAGAETSLPAGAGTKARVHPLGTAARLTGGRAVLLRWLCAATAAGAAGSVWRHIAPRLPADSCACGLRDPTMQNATARLTNNKSNNNSNNNTTATADGATVLWLEVQLLAAHLAVAGRCWIAAQQAAAAAERGLWIVVRTTMQHPQQ